MSNKELLDFLRNILANLELGKTDTSGHHLAIAELSLKKKIKQLQNDN